VELDLIDVFKRLAFDVDLDPYTVGYCVKRIAREGITFLTVTLPELSKCVLLSLKKGYFVRPTSICWKRQSLRYFAKFLNKIFDPGTGLLLEEPCALSLYSLRQLCEYNYKLALPFKEEVLDEFEDTFVKTDASVPSFGGYDSEWVDQLRKDFETYHSDLSRLTVDDILHEVSPKPGPGTFSSKKEFERDTNIKWYHRASSDYSYPEQFENWSWASRPLKSAPLARLAQDPIISEVLFVPKDSRGPRVIVREPFPLLRYHMAYNTIVANKLERATSFRVNFKDQLANRELAAAASMTGGWATLDLKNASDSVSAAIVVHLFRHSPGLSAFVNRRSRFAKLPSGKLIKLNKLAGMGSGLTFPTMSLLIHLSCTRAIVNFSGMPYEAAKKLVYVYGDDIIVPTKFVPQVKRGLDKVHLTLNESKSYDSGPFRESCGGDYLNGQDVAPVRNKLSGCVLTVSNTSHKLTLSGNLALLQLERHCRELMHAGLVRLADYYYSIIERKYGRLPIVHGSSPVIGRFSILQPDYPQDETGAYKTHRVIYPVPVAEEAFTDPYIHLRSRLVRRQPAPLAYLSESVDGSTFGEVNVPRTVKYRRTRVSGFRLMG